MKLQFLIPQYNEDEEVISSLLTSIALQQSIDFHEIGAIIINDGSNTYLNDDFLNSFPFKIEYIKNEHKGVSAARNCGLDNATADYVMFCDADDMFRDMLALFLIFKELDNGCEGLLCNFTEESRDTTNNYSTFYLDHIIDSTFVHGKIYKRQFLVDNNIRWNENLTIHEDSYFNTLAQIYAAEGNLRKMESSLYLWKWRGDSVCRKDKQYVVKTYPMLVDSADALLQELLTRQKIEKIPELFANLYYGTYYEMNKEDWLKEENSIYRQNLKDRLRNFYLKYGSFLELLSEQQKNEIILKVTNQKMGEGVVWPKFTFEDWHRYILSP